MTEENTDYLAYLLRLWRDSDLENVWRASVESPHTGESRGFARLDDLFGFLRQQTELLPDEVESRTSSDEGGDAREATEID